MEPEAYVSVEFTRDELEALLAALSDVEMDYTDLGVAKLKLLQATQ